MRLNKTQLQIQSMKKILITGATGNVGIEVIKSLGELNTDMHIFAGVRNVTHSGKLSSYPAVTLTLFDFIDQKTYAAALKDCNILFLLRPPEITQVNEYFKPLLTQVKLAGIEHIIFLSVQGADKSRLIPHHKIEKLIIKSGVPYTFLRPAYFMQNFTTTLRTDLVAHHEIFLPAGNARFTLIDVSDLGRVAAAIISKPEGFLNVAFDLTCSELLTFREMAKRLSQGLGVVIKYRSPNLLKFYLRKRKEKMSTELILVMIMLHYLPRFQRSPAISNYVKEITHVEPKSFERFIIENKALLES
jgi:uncharacterized protein YbjT (DUF2867 family)